MYRVCHSQLKNRYQRPKKGLQEFENDIAGLTRLAYLGTTEDITKVDMSLWRHEKHARGPGRASDHHMIELCQLFQNEVKYLGHLACGNGITVYTHKVHAFQKSPTSETKQNLRRFHGMCTYSRRCIPRFADLTKPLLSSICKVKKKVICDFRKTLSYIIAWYLKATEHFMVERSSWELAILHSDVASV